MEGANKGSYGALRKAMRIFLEKASITNFEIRACGNNSETLKDFKRALDTQNAYLLIDADAPLQADKWAHLTKKKNWQKPLNADETNTHLMVVTMETWLMADRAALQAYFKKDFNEKALPPLTNLENNLKPDEFLHKAALKTGKAGYVKGRDSFALLEATNPMEARKHAPSLDNFLKALA